MQLDDAIALLGKPYFQANNCAIYNQDCLEAMALLPQLSINLTVTSPPYNIGKEYEKSLLLNDYLLWCQEWIAQIYRITRPNGTFWLNLGYFSLSNRAKAIPIAYLLWDKYPSI
jgi:adenine-specific DNA-methyltransferase